MGYLITYLLLALAFDLIRELLNPDAPNRKAAVRRRLWSDTEFDCCSNVFAVEESIPRKKAQTSSVRPRNPRRRYGSWVVRPWKAENFV